MLEATNWSEKARRRVGRRLELQLGREFRMLSGVQFRVHAITNGSEDENGVEERTLGSTWISWDIWTPVQVLYPCFTALPESNENSTRRRRVYTRRVPSARKYICPGPWVFEMVQRHSKEWEGFYMQYWEYILNVIELIQRKRVLVEVLEVVLCCVMSTNTRVLLNMTFKPARGVRRYSLRIGSHMEQLHHTDNYKYTKIVCI